MNTRFCYFYRDACNYKQFAEIVIAGTLSDEFITSCLREKTYFIPSEVGLPELQPEPMTINDHIWHEIDHLEPTNDEPSTAIAAQALEISFKAAAKAGWNELEVIKRKILRWEM